MTKTNIISDRLNRIAKLVAILIFLASTVAVAALASPAGSFDLEGAILDSTGAAVAGAEVVLRPTVGAQEWRARSDSAGRFVFHSVVDGQYTLRVSASGFTATYQFLPGASLYFSYSESFLSQRGRIDDGTTNGAFVNPEKGRQWETGIKTFLLNGRATATLALYRLLRRNVATTSPANPNFVILTGGQRSQGVELETALDLLPGWNLTAAYAYIDAKVTEDTVIPVGTRTQNVPRNSYNLWTRYEFQRGWARGIGLGIGGRYYSAQAGDRTDTFQIPRYGLADALVSYRHGRFRLQLNVNNLLNKRYFTGSYDPLYVLPGAPRNARVTAGWTF